MRLGSEPVVDQFCEVSSLGGKQYGMVLPQVFHLLACISPLQYGDGVVDAALVIAGVAVDLGVVVAARVDLGVNHVVAVVVACMLLSSSQKLQQHGGGVVGAALVIGGAMLVAPALSVFVPSLPPVFISCCMDATPSGRPGAPHASMFPSAALSVSPQAAFGPPIGACPVSIPMAPRTPQHR